jgi:hypothetical protein
MALATLGRVIRDISSLPNQAGAGAPPIIAMPRAYRKPD